MVVPSPKPRYDRIVSLVLLVLIGLGLVFFIDSNPNILRARLGGDLPIITLSWALVASLVVITSTGADVFIRSHPQMQARRLPTLNLGIIALELAPGRAHAAKCRCAADVVHPGEPRPDAARRPA